MRKKIVTIGGGTGSFTLLSGLRHYPLDLTAIVAMADDGGSTGALRDELGVLPPGDVRQCLVALSDSSELLRALMSYRFAEGSLKGHNFGNLLLSALEKITGDFSTGVEEAARILRVHGEVVPVVTKNVRLRIALRDNTEILGENQLDQNERVRTTGIKSVSLVPSARANPKALAKISAADFVVIGPGDYYGDIVPCLLAAGMRETCEKTQAKMIFVCNLTNKKGQTEGFDVDTYVSDLEHRLGGRRIDYVVYNTKKASHVLLKKYEQREGKNMVVRLAPKKKRYAKVICADVLQERAARLVQNDPIASTRSFIRHDSEKLAHVLMMLVAFNGKGNLIEEIL